MAGWIKMHRQLLEWEWFSEPATAHLFVYLLLKASHEPSKWKGISIGAGEVLFGRHQASVDTGLSEQQIRTAITRLKSTNEITIKSTSKYSIISISNWQMYQASNQPANQRATSEQPATNHIQEDKNVIHTTHSKGGFEKVYEVGCELFPNLAVANTSSLQKWLAEGCDAELDIIPEVKRHAGKNITSWKYFEGGVADARATRLTPMKKGTPHGKAGTHQYDTAKGAKKTKSALRGVL